MKDDPVWTHWQWYKKFFNIVIIRFLVTWFAIVPLFAKLLSKLPDELKFKVMCEEYIIPLALPFKWEFLWLASFFFVIAYILYSLFCPQFIKTYSSFKDYLSHSHSPRWISRISKDLIKHSNGNNIRTFHNRLLIKSYTREITLDDHAKFLEEDKTKDSNKDEDKALPNAYIRQGETTLVYKLDEKLYAVNMPIVENGKENQDLTKIAEREIFWEVFGRFSSTKRGMRLTINALLLISLGLALVAIAQNIYTALSYFFK